MDAAVIRFKTALFDVTKERPNTINPIFGESLLLWLGNKLEGRVTFPQPATEDWGWYVDVDWEGRFYMLGASASDEEVNGEREWILQIVKHRSLKERLLGKEKMTGSDGCLHALLEILKREPSFSDVTVD
jgi:hypothetical protein